MVARKGRWFGADGAAPRFAWESLAFTAAVRFDRDGGDASSVTVRQSEHASIRQSAPEQRAPLSRGRSGAERSPAGVDAARILSLQRLAGNQAVTSMIAVQRYEAGEHAQFGAETGKPERTFVLRLGSSEITSGYGDVQAVKSEPNVIVMSYGEVIALGDFYKDFDQLAQAASTPEKFRELRQLVRLVRADVAAYTPGQLSLGPVSNEQWQEATSGRPKEDQYVNLSAKNADHFAPPTSDLPDTAQKGDNRSTWWENHLVAIDKATVGRLDEALLQNAFGDHFLTDAFSAGHMISKAELMEKARAKVDKLKWHAYTWYKHFSFRSSTFTDRLAQDILADPEGAQLSNYQIDLGQVTGEWHDVTAQTLSPLIGAIMKQQPDDILSLFAKAVHDWLNQDIERRWGGLEVENDTQPKTVWRLSGDGTLAASNETLEIARKAVARSQQDIVDAAAFVKTGKPVQAGEWAARVWDFVPHPTKKGHAKADQIVAELTDPERPETALAIAGIAVKNVPIMIDMLVNEKHRLRLKPGATPAPAATPTPAITPTAIPLPVGH